MRQRQAMTETDAETENGMKRKWREGRRERRKYRDIQRRYTQIQRYRDRYTVTEAQKVTEREREISAHEHICMRCTWLAESV